MGEQLVIAVKYCSFNTKYSELNRFSPAKSNKLKNIKMI